MESDKNQASETPSSHRAGGNGADVEGSPRKTILDIPAEHHYEPEAHHDWFTSEQALISWLSGGICGFVCLCVALTAHHIFNPGFRVGDLAERDIYAPHAAAVIDETATQTAREKVRMAQFPVFKADRHADTASCARLSADLDLVNALQKAGVKPLPQLAPEDQFALLNATDSDLAAATQAQPGTTKVPDDLAKAVQHFYKIHPKATDAGKSVSQIQQERVALQSCKKGDSNLTDYEITVAISIAPSDFANYRTTVDKALQRVCRVLARLPIDDAALWTDSAVEFLPDAWSQNLRLASAKLMTAKMQPNVTIDKAATAAKAAKAAAEVKPIMKQIAAGDLIVAKHQPITADEFATMQAMGITDINRWPIIVGLWVSLAAAVSLVGLFLYTFDAKFLFSTRSLALMYTLSVLTVALGAMLGKPYPQVVPLPGVALLLAIFFGQRTATAIIIPLAIFLAVDRMIGFNDLVALGTAAGAAIGTYSKRRHALVSTGLVIGMAQAFGFLASLAISQSALPATQLGSQLGMQFLGGIACSIVAIGILPFLENIFGLITPFRLAELTDADQPLLRRLEENAPGTYQHSLAVANLAEAGARAISADVNLVRAGAYYHDIGKMVRPKYFIENQLGATNPHDSMTPEQSRERVLAHVTDGLTLAKKYALPKAVQDFIPMHQGTSLMAYFYHKACLRDGVENVDPLSYRYPGPRPQSKETSIVMLADVSEAVTHSMKNPTEEEVDEAINKVFQNRWDDEQFSESGLSYSELQRVKKAFVRVWRTLHHDRLKYPSTTTGRMPVPPTNLPSAASLTSGITANEFPSEIDLSPPAATRAQGDATTNGGNPTHLNGSSGEKPQTISDALTAESGSSTPDRDSDCC